VTNKKYLEISDKFEVNYLFSYGGISRFFQEIIENQRIFGTRCSKCGKVYCPPRSNCSNCYVSTEWVPLDGKGTVIAAVYSYWVPANWVGLQYVDLPFINALVKLDGADTCLDSIVIVDDMTLNKKVVQGTRVKIKFRKKREGKISDFYFVLDED
jgi:uncharacterized OB-fold protein